MRFGASRSMFCLNHHKKRQDYFVAIYSCMLMACKFHRFRNFRLGRKVLKALQLHEFQDHGLTDSKVRVLLTPKVFHAMKSMKRQGLQTQLLSGNQSDKGFSATWGALVEDIRYKLMSNSVTISLPPFFVHLSIPQMVHVEGKRNELAHTPVQNGFCTVSLYPGIPIPIHIIPQTAISCSWSFNCHNCKTHKKLQNDAESMAQVLYANELQHMETDCARLVTTRVLQLPQLQEPEGQHATENQPVECGKQQCPKENMLRFWHARQWKASSCLDQQRIVSHIVHCFSWCMMHLHHVLFIVAFIAFMNSSVLRFLCLYFFAVFYARLLVIFEEATIHLGRMMHV